MFTRELVAELRRAAPNFVRRQAKTLGQARYGWDHRKQVAFVFGCQRSGTKMVMRVLDRSPATRIFHENHATAFSDFQLRGDAVLRALVALNPAPSQVFKPICDSHEADHLLARFPDAHGVWVYRHFDDVANSATDKWGLHQLELIHAIHNGDLTTWGWRTARLSDTVRAELRRVWRPDLTVPEGAMLFWYVRNHFFVELGLDVHPRMKLVKYEHLVQEPEAGFRAIFDHVGAPFDASFLDKVRATSVGRRAPAEASAEIRALCADLMARLDGWVSPVPAPSPPSPVLLLINTLGTGGAERYVVTVANWLVAHGVRVAICATPGELVAQLHPDVEFHATDLTRIRADLPRAAARVRAVLAALQPAVIVTNSLAVTWVARAADPRAHVPIVDVAHGWPDTSYPLVGKLMRVADRVVAVSPEVKAKLVAGGMPPEQVEVVLNGVDCRPLGRRVGAAREAARAAMGAGPDDTVVLTVGRTSAQKAQHHAIELAVRMPHLRFVIVGEGERDAELAALVQERGVGDRVRLLGLRSDVPDLLGSADVYLSCSDWEGMSLTIIEALASGLPVVATATEGSVHLVDAEVGRIVPIGEVAAMEAALGELGDPALRARLGDAGRARALGGFSHERMMAELVRVLALVRR